MSKVSFANLKLKINTEVNKFTFQEKEIEVLKYLPIEEKYKIVGLVTEMSKINNIYNPVLLDMFFHLYLVYSYTNLSFTDNQKEDEAKLYDLLKSNGFIDMLLMNIDEKEYAEMQKMIDEIVEKNYMYNISAAAIISSFIKDLPKNAEAAMQIVNSFDKNKYQEVIKFAEAANGGRPLNGAE